MDLPHHNADIGVHRKHCSEEAERMRQLARSIAVIVSCIIVIVSGVIPGGSTGRASGAAWVERRPAGDVGRDWYSLASDSSGMHLIAAAFGNWGTEGWVYTSTDGGAHWTIRYPSPNSQYWRAAASDADGSNLIVITWSGLAYTSSNGGADWTRRYPTGQAVQRLQTVASDADGSNLIVGASAGRIYTSSNGGADWTERRPCGNMDGDWRGASSNADGSVLLVGDYQGRLYITKNGGASWSELTPAGAADMNWQGTACDQDGTHLIVGVEGGRLYTSSDRGATWTERRPAGNVDRNWSRFASDSDGSVLLAADQMRLYLSLDSGMTWTEQRPAGDKDIRWTCCSNSDGSYLVAGGYAGGRLYTLGVDARARTLAVASVGSGTVTLDPPGGTYRDGTVVTLAAAPGAGYAFSGWSGDLSGAANPASITMNSDKAVTATFTAVSTYTLTPSAGAGGAITPNSPQTVSRGGTKTFTIVPSEGYHITDVAIDGVSQGAISSYTFSNVTSNHSIVARFGQETGQKTVMVLRVGKSAFTVNGASEALDSPPVIKNGRTLVPIRAIIEALGGTVGWDGTARKATVALGRVTIELWIGQSTARVNNISTRIDSTNLKVVPQIINGRTMLPLRFVTENLGATVGWEPVSQTITITYAP
jgi:photosystem II stability/assembly factor-like uncharacterized protein